MAKAATVKKTKAPSSLLKREVSGIENFPYAPGATLERVYHTYGSGRIVSIERFTASDGFIRVSAIELDDDFGVLVLHLFTNEDRSADDPRQEK